MRTVYEVWTKQHEHERYGRVAVLPDEAAARQALNPSPTGRWRQVENRLIPDEPRFGFVAIEREPDTAEDRIELALELIDRYGDIAGDHHRRWLLDEVATVLGGTPRGGGIAP